MIRPTILILALGVALAGDATTFGIAQRASAAEPARAAGRAFRCPAAECGTDIALYLRPKLGFCNCATGVSDDAELDRVGDLELLSAKFKGLRDGRPITVGWMNGRSRPYEVTMPYAAPRTALAIGFNDKCDVVVATVVATDVPAAERAALAFLNGDMVRRWVEKELGL